MKKFIFILFLFYQFCTCFQVDLKRVSTELTLPIDQCIVNEQNSCLFDVGEFNQVLEILLPDSEEKKLKKNREQILNSYLKAFFIEQKLSYENSKILLKKDTKTKDFLINGYIKRILNEYKETPTTKMSPFQNEDFVIFIWGGLDTSFVKTKYMEFNFDSTLIPNFFLKNNGKFAWESSLPEEFQKCTQTLQPGDKPILISTEIGSYILWNTDLTFPMIEMMNIRKKKLQQAKQNLPESMIKKYYKSNSDLFKNPNQLILEFSIGDFYGPNNSISDEKQISETFSKSTKDTLNSDCLKEYFEFQNMFDFEFIKINSNIPSLKGIYPNQNILGNNLNSEEIKENSLEVKNEHKTESNIIDKQFVNISQLAQSQLFKKGNLFYKINDSLLILLDSPYGDVVFKIVDWIPGKGTLPYLLAKEKILRDHQEIILKQYLNKYEEIFNRITLSKNFVYEAGKSIQLNNDQRKELLFTRDKLVDWVLELKRFSKEKDMGIKVMQNIKNDVEGNIFVEKMFFPDSPVFIKESDSTAQIIEEKKSEAFFIAMEHFLNSMLDVPEEFLEREIESLLKGALFYIEFDNWKKKLIFNLKV